MNVASTSVDQNLVIQVAHDLLDVAEVQRHVEIVARENLAGDGDVAAPRMAVNETALAGVAQLAVTGVELRVDDDLLHVGMTNVSIPRHEEHEGHEGHGKDTKTKSGKARDPITCA